MLVLIARLLTSQYSYIDHATVSPPNPLRHSTHLIICLIATHLALTLSVLEQPLGQSIVGEDPLAILRLPSGVYRSN
jgi:hypothetical protein